MTTADKAVTFTASAVTLNKVTGEIQAAAVPGTPKSKGTRPFAMTHGRSIRVGMPVHGVWSARLTDVSGKVLSEKRAQSAGDYLLADNLPAGVYLVRLVYSTDRRITARLLVR